MKGVVILVALVAVAGVHASQDMVMPSQDMAMPSQDMVMPSQDMVMPSQDMVMPSQDMFMPTCSCGSNTGGSCFGAFTQKGRFTYHYETYVKQYIPGYKEESKFFLSAFVDFTFFEGSCVGEMKVYDVRAYDSSFQETEFQGDAFYYMNQEAAKHGELDLFYMFNTTLPKYSVYFCYSDFRFDNLYPHRDEPVHSMNFKRGIFSTFQSRFCPNTYKYMNAENAVDGYNCQYDYEMYPYANNNFTAYKTMKYDTCQERKTYSRSSFYGQYFAEGKSPVSTTAYGTYQYFDQMTRYISYEERYEFSLAGYQFPKHEDFGSVFTVVRQTFEFMHFYDKSYPFSGFSSRYYFHEPRQLQYEPYNFYQNYNFEYDDFDTAFDLVREVTQFKRDTQKGDFLDKFYELQRRFRYFDFEQFKMFFMRFSADPMCSSFEGNGRYTCRRTFFEAVMAVGGDASAQFFKYLVFEQSDFFGQEDQMFGMWSFVFSEYSSETIINSIYDTCQHYSSDERFWGRCALALGSLTRRFCDYNECPFVNFTSFESFTPSTQFSTYYEKVFYYFYREFYTNRFTFNPRAFFAFKAMGNMARGDKFGYLRSFYHFFSSVAFDSAYPMQYRMAAFEYFSYSAQYFYGELYQSFFNMFYDEHQPTELRIAAFNGLMYTFKFGKFYEDSRRWGDMFEVFRMTKDEQFYCYGYSYLYRMVDTEYFPDRYWTRYIAFYFGRYDYFYTSRIYKCKGYGYRASQVQQYAFPADFFPTGSGAKFTSSVQYKDNFFTFPNQFFFQFDSYFYNYAFQPFEFGFESFDFRKVFDFFSGPDGFFFRKGAQPRDIGDFKFNFFFRMFEYELLYEEFDQNYFMTTFESQQQYFQLYRTFYTLFQDGYSYRGVSNLVYQLKQFNSFSGFFSFFTDTTFWKNAFEYSLTFRGFDYQYTIPTRVGFPLVYNMTAYFNFQTLFKAEVSCDKSCQYSYGFMPDRMQSKFHFAPRYSGRFYGSVSFYTTYFAPSVQFEFSANGGFEQMHNATFYMDGRFEYDYTLPKTYTQLATFGGKFFFYYYRASFPYRYFQITGQPTYNDFQKYDYLRPIPFYYDTDYKSSWFYNAYDYMGFNFTSMSSYANFTNHFHGFPPFPFNGEFNFTFGMMPREYFNGHQLTNQQMTEMYEMQPFGRYTFFFRNFSDHQQYDLEFFPPVYGYAPYTKPTLSYRFERKPYFDNYGFRYFNISTYGQRHPRVTGYDFDEESFNGYFSYRDFEGDYSSWMGRSFYNATFFYKFYNPYFSFSTFYYGNSTYYNYNSRFYYFEQQNLYEMSSYGYQNPRSYRGYFNFNFDGQRYYFNYFTNSRYFMNDIDVETDFYPMTSYSKYKSYNFFAMMPPTTFEQCQVFDMTYVSFDGRKYEFSTGCDHYLVYNDYFNIMRMPRGQYYDIRVDFTQKFGGFSFFFSEQFFEFGGQKYYLHDFKGNQDYKFGEFDFRLVHCKACGCYRIYFTRFHFELYFCPESSNIGMSPYYFGRTYGMCGNMNKDPSDDMMMRDTHQPATSLQQFYTSFAQGRICSDFRNAAMTTFSSPAYYEAYDFCYKVYNRAFSHCNQTFPADYYLERCAQNIFDCRGSRDECMRSTLCAYTTKCASAGYYPYNSCFVSDWSPYLRTYQDYQMYKVASYEPFYSKSYFGNFLAQAPMFMQPFYAESNMCTATRVSTYYYPPSSFGNYKTGFQWCQRRDNDQMTYRYTYSNFFLDMCPTTRCCQTPGAKPFYSFVFQSFGTMRCQSSEKIPQCPTGYFAQKEQVSTEFRCPMGHGQFEEFYRMVPYARKCFPIGKR